jgi:flagellar hook-basal body complex protein FliE
MSVEGINSGQITEGINSKQIASMLALLRNTAAQAAPPLALDNVSASKAVGMTRSAETTQATAQVDFAEVLKNSLNQVNQMQKHAQNMADQFALGDGKVSLSDTMLALQKARIGLEITVQERNQIVKAYTDIMNMSI